MGSAIARVLGCTYGGDPASADWRHLGRLAGFTNQKPARRPSQGYPPWVKIVHARAGLAPQASALVESARKSPPLEFDERSSRPSQDLAPRSALLTTAEAHRVYDDCVHRWRIAHRFPRPDWSIVDL